ncbi:hypothetical protein MDA_GLEAN10024957 [Myotis davidii]|uniref:Uncharacterized protein n=1 Tax=Myotis davidii TaxID=225400 RepID=L5LS19_MYODS|nr:hypothetical protein MDA_GLEAN10024957 [Myotis davidii]
MTSAPIALRHQQVQARSAPSADGSHSGGELTCGFILNCLYLESSVHLDLLNHQRIYIYNFKLSITLCIAKHVQQKFSTLSGPPTLRSAPLFGLDTHTNSTTVMME